MGGGLFHRGIEVGQIVGRRAAGGEKGNAEECGACNAGKHDRSPN